MNAFRVFAVYQDLLSQTYSVLNSAVYHHSEGAKSEINRLLDRVSEKMTVKYRNGVFYRARCVKPEEYGKLNLSGEIVLGSKDSGIMGFSSNEMGAPPPEKVNSGRANKEKEALLYLASNKETACAEVQPVCDDLISVAPFELVDEVSLADLRDNPTGLQCFTNEDDPDKLVDLVFCSILVDLFCMPVKSNDTKIYESSQYIANYFRQQGVSGLLYNSSHNSSPNSFNLVLFDPSLAKCTVECAELMKCLSVSSSFQSVSKNCSSSSRPEIIEAKKEIEPFNWATMALLHRDLSRIQKRDANENET